MSDEHATLAPGARDERLLHRLEAFSDIVLGFSLAQLGLNLTLPHHSVSEIFVEPYGLIAFAATFSVISTIWYSHHRLFANYFKPRALTIVLNFVLLGFVVLQVYALQVFVKFTRGEQIDPAATFYFAVFAIVYALLGTLFGIGLHDRWNDLDATLRSRGMRSTFRLFGVAAALICGIWITDALHWPTANAPFLIIPVLLAIRLGFRFWDSRAQARAARV